MAAAATRANAGGVVKVNSSHSFQPQISTDETQIENFIRKAGKQEVGHKFIAERFLPVFRLS